MANILLTRSEFDREIQIPAGIAMMRAARMLGPGGRLRLGMVVFEAPGEEGLAEYRANIQRWIVELEKRL